MSAGVLDSEVPVREVGEGRPLGWWGVVTTVMTEGLLFALLLYSYFSLRGRAGQWPPAGIEAPELVISGIRSVLLLSTSATVSWAERGIRKGQVGRYQVGIAATLVLAAVFVAGHVQEMIELPSKFTWETNAYGSLFYVITNAHIAHLVIGMAFLAFSLIAARRGRYTAEKHLGVKVVSIYWHFVDVVWVAVYSSLYLYPHIT